MKVNGDLLRGKVYEKGYNLKSFSEEIEISAVTLSNVLMNHFKPSYTVMAKMIQCLDLQPVEVVNIFFEKGDKKDE